jgi:C4-dicarboxylate-specific signal transduction histidine kinase
VNQPLAAIVTNGDAGLLWLNREVPQVDEVRSAVERMIDCAKHAREVIARLRALSRNATSETVRLDINEVVNEVLALIRHEISNHQVSVQLDLASALPVIGDRVQLQQVIMNLLVNGIQAIAPVNDRPRELLIRSRAHNSEQVLVEVRDSGVGIDPEHVGQLFNPSSRRRPMAWAWACRYVAQSSRPMAGEYGHRQMRAPGQIFSLRSPRIALTRCNRRERHSTPGAS